MKGIIRFGLQLVMVNVSIILSDDFGNAIV